MNYLSNMYRAGRSGQACPTGQGLGATGVELAIGGGIIAVAGTTCYFVGRWRGRKANEVKTDCPPKTDAPTA